MHFFSEKNIAKLIRDLLARAVSFGISHEGKLIVEEYLEYNEFGLAFEHIAYELYENNIGITQEYLDETKKVGDLMKINKSEYCPELEKLILK